MRFSREVDVDTNGGTPRLAARVGAIGISVPYTSGSMSGTLTFSATLGNGFPSATTVLVAPNAPMLNGGSIRSAQTQDASTEHLAFAFVGEAPALALTASLESAPDGHNGEDAFELRVAFSAPITASVRKFPQAFDVTKGEVASAARVNGRSDLWTVTVEPSGDDDVTVTLAGGGPAAPAASHA